MLRIQLFLTLRKPAVHSQRQRKCLRSSRTPLLQHLDLSDTSLFFLLQLLRSREGAPTNGSVLLRTLSQRDAAFPSEEAVYG